MTHLHPVILVEQFPDVHSFRQRCPRCGYDARDERLGGYHAVVTHRLEENERKKLSKHDSITSRSDIFLLAVTRIDAVPRCRRMVEEKQST